MSLERKGASLTCNEQKLAVSNSFSRLQHCESALHCTALLPKGAASWRCSTACRCQSEGDLPWARGEREVLQEAGKD